MKLALRLLVDPVPASRPRFVRRGNFTSTYYAGRYKDYLQESGPCAVDAALRAQPLSSRGVELPITDDVIVVAEFLVKKPKTTKLSSPRGDVDNYGKGLLDILQASRVIADDKQVTHLTLSKAFTEGQPCVNLTIQTANS